MFQKTTNMPVLETWMRVALLATGVMNLCGCLSLAPPITIVRRTLGIPEAPPIYLWLLTIWIGAFGAIYLWLGWTGRIERAFLLIAAIGKISFWGLLCIYWLRGEFGVLAPIVASGDLIFGVLFCFWLLQDAKNREPGTENREPRTGD